jgi:outer membrane protein assembly factor BamB
MPRRPPLAVAALAALASWPALASCSGPAGPGAAASPACPGTGAPAARGVAVRAATFRADSAMSSSFAGPGLRRPPRQRWDLAATARGAPSFSLAGSLVVLSRPPWLCALRLGDGSLAWATRAGTGGVPAAEGGEVFVAGEQDRAVHAYALDGGRPLWRAPAWPGAGTGPPGLWPALAVPDAGRLFVTSPWGVSALDASSGRSLWRHPLAGARSGLAVSGSGVYVVDGSGVLHALDVATGAERWSRPVSDQPVLPSVGSGLVVVASLPAGQVVALDPQSGSPRWSAGPFASPVGLAVGPGVVYDASGASGLVALDAITGQLRWSFVPPSDVPPGVGPEATTQSAIDVGPCAQGDVVYVGNLRGRIFALDAGGHQLLWQFRLRELDAVFSGFPLQAAPGRLVVGLAGGETLGLG